MYPPDSDIYSSILAHCDAVGREETISSTYAGITSLPRRLGGAMRYPTSGFIRRGNVLGIATLVPTDTEIKPNLQTIPINIFYIFNR